MTTDQPDWQRLQKALTIEAEQGFTNLQGRQYRFCEFLCLTFGKFPTDLPSSERRQWQNLAMEYASYPNLELEARRELVVQTRQYLWQLEKNWGSGEETIQNSKYPAGRPPVYKIQNYVLQWGFKPQRKTGNP
jgi:ATP-dependent DNA helicase RecG